ncbi:MAG: hypothetical protein QM737_00485 [Ferruginibacter sp.]
MNLREEILREHSKEQCIKIVRWVGDDQKRFDELFYLFLNDEYRVVQRAGWPVSNCVMKHPDFITKHWANLIKNVQKPNLHGAVKRNTVRLLQDIDIPEQFQGEIMNICFAFVESPTEEVAVKAFSLTILGNLAKKYPEIIPELKLLIESQIEDQTAAFKSRGTKLLKGFSKVRS